MNHINTYAIADCFVPIILVQHEIIFGGLIIMPTHHGICVLSGDAINTSSVMVSVSSVGVMSWWGIKQNPSNKVEYILHPLDRTSQVVNDMRKFIDIVDGKIIVPKQFSDYLKEAEEKEAKLKAK